MATLLRDFPVQAVCFDVFGTLIQPPLSDPFQRLLVSVSEDRRRALRQKWLSTPCTWPQACLDAGASAPQAQEGADALRHLCATLTLLPQAERALGVCRARGWKTAIASNLATPYVAPVERLLHGRVAVLAWSCVQGLVKPDPRLFEALEQEWGAGGAACAMVGDSHASDMAVGRSRGWKTWWIQGEPGASLAQWCDQVEAGWGD